VSLDADVGDLKEVIKEKSKTTLKGVCAVDLNLFKVDLVQCPQKTNFGSLGDILTGQCMPGHHRPQSSE
jgi:hypothetical protein